MQVLELLRDSPLAPSISLLLNPVQQLSQLPMKAFYRYALPDVAPGGVTHVCVLKDFWRGGLVVHLQTVPRKPSLSFQCLSVKLVCIAMTMHTHAPAGWLVA
jgi:hypothetical protein